ncbi:MAG TPA: type II toxin-antitoxin system RelE/ParE family toxin [Pyrinomonadaceae bacterium]|jgi:mRNA interferase RelE/StbE
MYEVVITTHAEREVRRLDRQVKNRILTAATTLADNPRPPGSIKIKGQRDLWRIRVGAWRIGYEINDEARVVRIITIGHRREFYK